MKEEENNIIKQVYEHQLYIQHYLIPLNYNSNPNQIEHYQSTLQLLTEENHHLRKLLNLNQQQQLISLTKEQLQEEVYKMIDFLMNHLNCLSKEQIFAYQKTFRFCAQKKALKYLKAVKTREEMIKFIIRKSMKYQKQTQDPQQTEEKKEIKKMNNAFVKQLFQNILDFLYFFFKQRIDPYFFFSETLQLIQIKLLKLSKYQYYIQFKLDQYRQLALNENQQKIKKYVIYIVELILCDKINQVMNYKRFPWLNDWIQQSVKSQETQKMFRINNLNKEKSEKYLKKNDKIVILYQFIIGFKTQCKSDYHIDIALKQVDKTLLQQSIEVKYFQFYQDYKLTCLLEFHNHKKAIPQHIYSERNLWQYMDY